MSGKHRVSCNNAPFKAHIVRQILQLRLLNIVWLSLLLLACSKERFDAPMCRHTDAQPSLPAGPAACIVRIESKLLVIKTEQDAWHLPSGKTQHTLSRQCTAHLAVWQLTGLNVEVAELVGKLSNNTAVFACHLNAGFDETTQSLPVPDWAQYKVQQIGLLDPFAITPRDWQPQDELITIRTYFNHVNTPQVSHQQTSEAPMPEQEPKSD
jgi:hypothetical protein